MEKRKSFLLFLFFFTITAAKATNNSTVVPPVIVKATPVSLTSGPETIITQQQITNTGSTNLADTLQDLGGVQVQNTIGNNSQVSLNLRGFGENASSNSLLLINGIPITNPDMAPPDLNAIPLYAIKYIEVIAGSESVLYGDQAVGGLINIVTNEQNEQNAQFSCGTGSYDQYTCHLVYTNHYRQLNYHVAISHDQTDNYRANNDYVQNLLLGGFAYPYQRGRIDIDYTVGNENMQYPGALTLAQVRENRRQAANDMDFFKDANGFFHLKQTQYLTTNWASIVDVALRKMDGNGVLTSPFTQSRLTQFIKPQLKGTVNNISFTGGADLESDQYQLNSAFGDTQNKLQKYGVFSLFSVAVSNKLNFSVGARAAEQSSQLNTFTITNNINRALATTLGATYQLTNDSQFYLRRAGSFRFPKADENADTAAGVTALQTQRGIAYETGMIMGNKNRSFKIGVYQLNLRDEIAFDPTQTPETPFGSNRNLAPTKRNGFSLSANDQLTQKLAWDGQYNFVNARFQSGVNAGNRIPLVSENMFHTGLHYQFDDAWSFYPEIVFTGNQYAANDDANIAGIVGGYTLYNVNLRYQYHQFSADFRLNNLFNKYYYFYTDYESSLDTDFFYPAPGRNFMLTLNYSIN